MRLATTASAVVNSTPPARQAAVEPLNALLVEAPRRVLDEAHPAAAQEEAADRGVVADVRGDPEDDDLLRVERVEQRLRVRVREDAEALLQEQDLAAAADEVRHQARRKRQEAERQRILLLGLGDLLGAAGAAQAVRRVRVTEIRVVGDLGIGQLVVVGGGDVDDAASRAASTSRFIAGIVSSAPGT